MFLHLSVILSTGEGVSATPHPRHTPPGRHPPGKEPPGQTPPGRHPQAPTLWEETPPGQTSLAEPPGQTPSLSSACWDTHPSPCPLHAGINRPCPVHAGIHPLPSACWDMVNKRVVHILLEYTLVVDSLRAFLLIYHISWKSWWPAW